MEFGFEEFESQMQKITEFRFNPCFYGIWIRRPGLQYIYGNETGFNPCFYGIWIRSIIVYYNLTFFSCVSILVFMEFGFEDYDDDQVSIMQYSFNPCFYGIWIRSLCCVPSFRSHSAFQSLFLWNLDSKFGGFVDEQGTKHVSILVFMEFGFEELMSVHRPPHLRRFNPCFYGIWIRRTSVHVLTYCNSSFQSLFLWNLDSKPYVGKNSTIIKLL